MNIWQSYKQDRGCLTHFARLANTLLKDEESARDNRVLACNFAKYLPIKKITDRLSYKPFLICILYTWRQNRHMFVQLPTDVVASNSLAIFRRLLKRFLSLFKQSYPDIIYWHHPASGPCSGCAT